MIKVIKSTCISLTVLGSILAASFAQPTPIEAATYNPQLKAIYMGSNLITKPYGIVANNTTYIPIWYVMYSLDKLGIQHSWDGTTWALTAPSYMPVDLMNLNNSTGSKTITLNGTTITRVHGIVYTDPASHAQTTYMPIWYMQQLLNRLGIGSDWNGNTWTLTTPPPISITVADPSQYPLLRDGNSGYPVVLLQQKLNAAGYNVGVIDGQFDFNTEVAVKSFQNSANLPSDGIVGQTTWLALNQRLANILAQSGLTTSTPITSSTGHESVLAWANSDLSITDAEQQSSITDIYNDNYTFNQDGTIHDLTSSPAVMSNLLSYGRTHNINVFAAVTNIDPSTGDFSGAYTHTVLTSDSVRTNLEKSIVNIATQDGYKGINLDFESINPSDKTIFTQFLTELSSQLHAANKQLSIAVPAETGAISEPWDGAYDYAAIGNIADVVPIMTYDFSWSGSAPGPIAPLFWDDQVLKYATTSMPASKILLGLGTYGYDWNTTKGGNATGYSLNTVDSIMSQHNVTPNWDSTDAVPYFNYTDSSGSSHIVYYENQASIQQKLNLAARYGVAGISFWKAGNENQAFWNTIQPFVNQTSTNSGSQTKTTTQ